MHDAVRKLGTVTAIALILGACGDATSPNTPPTADAGADQEVTLGETAQLNGTGTDADGDALTYAWSITSAPSGSTAAIMNASSASAQLTPDVAGDYTLTLQVSDGTDTATDDVVITAALDTELAGTLGSDTTLRDVGQDYHVVGNLTLNAALTIEPGVTLRFDAGTRLIVGTGGSIIAVGTEADTIRFLGTQDVAGHWDGIDVETTSTDNQLTYVEVANGGSGGWADVYVSSSGRIAIAHSLIRASATSAVEVASGGVLADFTENTLASHTEADVTVPAGQVSALDSLSSYGDRIVIDASTLGSDATWQALNAPYVSGGNLFVEGALTIDPGATLQFGQGHRLVVDNGGSLAAVGTAEDTIRFLGTESSQGFWDGIEVATTANANELTYTEIANGGDGGYANVYVQSSGKVKITSSRIHDSSTYGVDVEDNGSIEGFTANTFADNASGALHVPTSVVGLLDNASVYGGGSTGHMVEVFGGTVASAQTWPRTDAPLVFTSNAYIDDAITVEMGADLQFDQGVRLVVENAGSLHAVGADTAIITFRGRQDSPGYWDGIEVATVSLDNELTYTEVANGGDGGYANVYVQSSGRIMITHSLFRDGGTHGIDVEQGGSLEGFAVNGFQDNAMAALNIPTDVMGQLDGASTYTGNNGTDGINVFGGTVSTAQTWAKTDAPFIFSAVGTIEGAVTVEPGATILFAQGARLDVQGTDGSLNAQGTASDTITFAGTQAAQGFWDGINVETVSSDNVLDYTDIGYGGSQGYADVYIQSTGSATVTNSAIHDSATYGIEVEAGGVLTTDGSNSYSNNASGDVMIH